MSRREYVSIDVAVLESALSDRAVRVLLRLYAACWRRETDGDLSATLLRRELVTRGDRHALEELVTAGAAERIEGGVRLPRFTPLHGTHAARESERQRDRIRKGLGAGVRSGSSGTRNDSASSEIPPGNPGGTPTGDRYLDQDLDLPGTGTGVSKSSRGPRPGAFAFTCTECRAPDTLPEAPTHGYALLCRTCFAKRPPKRLDDAPSATEQALTEEARMQARKLLLRAQAEQLLAEEDRG